MVGLGIPSKESYEEFLLFWLKRNKSELPINPIHESRQGPSYLHDPFPDRKSTIHIHETSSKYPLMNSSEIPALCNKRNIIFKIGLEYFLLPTIAKALLLLIKMEFKASQQPDELQVIHLGKLSGLKRDTGGVNEEEECRVLAPVRNWGGGQL